LALIEICVGIVIDAGYVLKWVGESLLHPISKGWHDIAEFFSYTAGGLAAAWKVIRPDPLRGLSNILGDFVVNVMSDVAGGVPGF
jgi:hypothetical protein